MIIELRDIDNNNRVECEQLSVRSEEKQFIASNADSLITAENSADIARPFAIYADGRMVGFTMFAFDENNDDPEDKYWLWRFMIDEKEQGKGFGTAALAEIIRYFREQNADIITLSTKATNSRALKLYYQFGFSANGQMNDDEIVLKLYL